MPVGTRYSRRLATTLGVLMAAACVASGATAADASPTTGPGPTTSPVTLTTGYTLSGYDVATSSSGTAYIGWIANTSKSLATRAVHLCEVKPGTTSCSGGVQAVDALGDSSAEGLRVLVHASGRVALVWFYEGASGGQIGSASTTSTGKLQPAIDVGSAPKDGQLLDAEIAPDGSVWTVAGPSDGNGIQVSIGGGTTASRSSRLPAQCRLSRHKRRDTSPNRPATPTSPMGRGQPSTTWRRLGPEEHAWVSLRRDQVYDSPRPSITRTTSPWLPHGPEPGSQSRSRRATTIPVVPGATIRSLTPVVDWPTSLTSAMTSR
jgi:hypothetical protein